MTKHQSKGRPGGNPARPSRLSLEPQTPGAVLAQAQAAGRLMPSLVQQFAAASPDAQLRLFRLLEVVGGMGHAEKEATRVTLGHLRQLDGITFEVSELLAAVDSLVSCIDHQAHPNRGPSIADRVLAAFAADEADRVAGQEG